MFSKAIVRRPCRNMVNGLTSAELGKPDYEKALIQHDNYITALQSCGLEVTVLPPDENFPDSVFVEDTALLTPHCAIITNPGADSRKGETASMADVIKDFYKDIEYIKDPGTVEAGDIMMTGSHFYIGLSSRTNQQGADQLITILEKYDMSGSMIPLENVLHLKTGLAYLENNNLVAAGEFISKPEFHKFNILPVPEKDSYSANCIWINEQVLIPAGFPETSALITAAGYSVLELDMSEFQKLDGGLSCLSLRF